MKELLEVSRSERLQFFQEATARSKSIKNPIIIEKDFWVCWTLDQIFSNPILAPHITFKGGTSLSKCYGIINRFSEDIDLTLSKQFIGIINNDDSISATTLNQRNKRLEKLTRAAKNKITYEVKPLLIKEFREQIAVYFNEVEWRLETDESDEQSLIFHYPSCFKKNHNEYIQNSIKLEFGARGDNSPSETKTISPYIQQLLPEIFISPQKIKVTSLTAKRTYWEKITLLHAEYHRSPQKSLPSRIFRHYYDVVMLNQNNLTQEILQDTKLLDDVVKNKMAYFPSKWAYYDTATIGKLRLYPNTAFIETLKEDYKKMTEMFFGDAPEFDYIISEIRKIEQIINGTS